MNIIIKNDEESRAAANKPRSAEAILFGLKFANELQVKV